MWPSSSTMIRSACWRLAARWLTMNTVMLPGKAAMALRKAASVAKSRALALSSKIRMSGFATRARAMVRRWRCPPEKFCPPCSTGSSRPRGLARTKPAAWAVSRAAHSSASVARRSPHSRFERMVPVNSWAFCITMPTRLRKSSRGQAAAGRPNSSTLPSVAS